MKLKQFLLISTICPTIVISFLYKSVSPLRVGVIKKTYLSSQRIAITKSCQFTIIPHQSPQNQSALRMTSTEEKKSDGDHLWKFATHTSETYHDFSPEDAAAIRSALLTWYRANRRKLPWRGDVGPYTGSTAGIATSNAKKSAMKKNANTIDITSFFGKEKKVGNGSTCSSSASNDAAAALEKMETSKLKRIPITGYSVWVSEIMLQQTRVEAVIKYYLKWMESFPTVQDLANATEDEVNAHWAGLGFYRRARLLHKGAKFVVEELDGVVPDSVDELLKLSGIGRYTSSAIASIAFDKCVPVVDGNVCRVISRLKGVANNIKAPIFKDKIGWRLAEQIVKAGDGMHAGEVNQALMELGATYCAPSGTGVHEDDPLVEFYVSTKIGIEANELIKKDSLEVSDFVSNASLIRGNSSCSLCEDGGISNVLFQLAEDLTVAHNDPGQSKYAAPIGHSKFPTAPPRKAKREEVLSVAAMSHLDSSGHEMWFMIKRPADGLLAGQWEFPTTCAWSSATESKGTKSKSKKEIVVPSINKVTLRRLTKNLLRNCTIDHKEPATLEDLWNDKATKKVVLEDSPMQHIFSHVRWNMHCEYGDVSSSKFSSVMIENDFVVKNEESTCSWMSEADMHDVGITSSVKKILAAVKGSRTKQSNKRRKIR